MTAEVLKSIGSARKSCSEDSKPASPDQPLQAAVETTTSKNCRTPVLHIELYLAAQATSCGTALRDSKGSTSIVSEMEQAAELESEQAETASSKCLVGVLGRDEDNRKKTGIPSA